MWNYTRFKEPKKIAKSIIDFLVTKIKESNY